MVLADDSGGDNWGAYGRTFGEQHYSPLTQISDRNVGGLKLLWSMDLPAGANSATAPIAVDGVLYFASGYSVVSAVDAATGRRLWSYDPEVAKVAGEKLRLAWGSRGIAWWNGKIYTGTHDGRLIAIDAETGKPVWSAMTVEPDDERYITGAPRVFDGKVIIGHGGADVGNIRGYVTTYDAETGRLLWRFHTVPGNPADGFEDAAMEMAAETWAGEWWKFGGGGTVWNAITYDAEFDTIYIGTGNGSPWNYQVRSQGKGDNLFLCSIIALEAKTGAYKWHYQMNPGESWDFNAAMDMALADLTIDGQPRKVLITAPKNGFLYVLDRKDGRLVSAEAIVKVTWASRIDLKTGRPVEAPNIRFEKGPVTFSPMAGGGAHSWPPMSFNPKTGLVYIPTIEIEAKYDDAGVDRKTWRRLPHMALDNGVNSALVGPLKDSFSSLVAWDPRTQKQVWRLPLPGAFNGGTMTTGGNLVFQGWVDGSFNAFAANDGRKLWSFAAGAPVIAPPITYAVKGQQVVTVLTGNGTSAGLYGPLQARYLRDPMTQPRRVLTFALNGRATLPASNASYGMVPITDETFRADANAAARGARTFGLHCAICHGPAAIASGHAPDLRASAIITQAEAFKSVLKEGVLRDQGMPVFSEFSDQEREDLRTYIRSRADEARRESAKR